MMAENTNPEFPCFVVDNSFLVSFLLGDVCADEKIDAKDSIMNLLKANGQLYVPQLFWFEIGNVLLNASRPSKVTGVPRITMDQKMRIERCLSELPIYTDLQPDSEVRIRIGQYAAEFNLSYYDASYLELARRFNLELKTFDQELLKAWKSFGVK